MTGERPSKPCEACGVGRVYAKYKSALAAKSQRKYCSPECRRQGVRARLAWTPTELEEAFLSSFEPEPMSGCWLWTGTLNTSGYGQNHGHGLVHRYAWTRARGPIAAGMVIDHKCRVRSCVNVDHLRVVTPAVNSVENSVSFSARNKVKTHCPRGHAYDKIVKAGRWCTVCDRATQRARDHKAERARRKAAREAA